MARKTYRGKRSEENVARKTERGRQMNNLFFMESQPCINHSGGTGGPSRCKIHLTRLHMQKPSKVQKAGGEFRLWLSQAETRLVPICKSWTPPRASRGIIYLFIHLFVYFIFLSAFAVFQHQIRAHKSYYANVAIFIPHLDPSDCWLQRP